MKKINAIVIDDDPSIELILQNTFQHTFDIQLESALDEKEAKKKLNQKKFDLIFLDLVLENTKGEDLIPWILNANPKAKIIILTGRKEVQIAAECLKKGAFDFIEKPLHPGILEKSVSEIHFNESSNTNTDLQTKLAIEKSNDLIIGTDPKTIEAISHAYQLASADCHVLINGPTGCGKEVFAEYIHRNSNRKGPFLKINIAGVDDNFFSDILFGHKKQAYTGADQELIGIVADAEEGTVLLDEIGDMPLKSQVKLLRLVQFGEYYPIGSNELHFTKTRFLFATNINLLEKVKSGAFREDLYYRIISHHVTIPSLKERKESIEELIYFFIAKECKQQKRPMSIPTRDYTNKLSNYDFPGNIRELEYIIKNSLIHAPSKYLQADDINLNSAMTYVDATFSDLIKSIPNSALPTLKEITNLYINDILSRNQNNQTKTAKDLGITQQALNQRLKKNANNHNK